MLFNPPLIWANGIMPKNTSLMSIPIMKNIIYGKLCSVSMTKNIKKSKSTLEETDNLFTRKSVNSSTFPMKEKWKVLFDYKHLQSCKKPMSTLKWTESNGWLKKKRKNINFQQQEKKLLLMEFGMTEFKVPTQIYGRCSNFWSTDPCYCLKPMILTTGSVIAS